MTFTDIQNVITDRLKIKSTDTDSITRVGRLINLAYREITAGLGMSASRRSTISASASVGSNLITFTGSEKIERVFYVDDTDIILTEITFLEMRDLSLSSSDTPTRYAIKSRTDDTIVVAFDVNFATAMTVYADVWATVATLSGSDEPAFPPSYHDVLVHAVLGQEYLRAEKPALADREETKYNRRMSQLRNWNAVSATMRLRQGQAEGDTAGEGGTAGGGGSTLTVNGPASGVSTDNAIARWDGTGGRTIQNSGITIADGASGTLAGSNSGDVTLVTATADYLSISSQAITLALINLASATHVTGRLPYANLTAATAAARLLGRRAASAGDWEEISAGTNLEFSTTTLKLVDAVVIGTSVTIPNSGLKVLDTNASHSLVITPGSDLTAERILSLVTGDAARTVTLTGNPTLADWFDQSVKTTADPTFNTVKLNDSNDSHQLTVAVSSDLTAARTLSLATGDADRTITLSGNPTLADWFDQSVKVASTPTFGATTITGPLTISGASAGQIVFPASQNASSDANTLDDYEEGSWSPTLAGSGGQSGQAYTTQLGRYIKIGKQVKVWGRLTLSTLGTVTGNAQIGSLPFTAENVTDLYGDCHINFWNNLTSSFVHFSGQIVANTTVVTLLRTTAAATSVGTVVQADLANTTDIIFKATYRATA